MNEFLILVGQPPLKKLRSGLFLPVENSNGNNAVNESWIEDLKTALFNENSRSGKISLLTTVPLEWSIRRMARELDVSRRMASRAKKLHISNGYGAYPEPKNGRRLEANIVEKVEEFYFSEENSRIMPGKKDCISVVKNGQRRIEQKRLLLFNLNELHENFFKKFPEIKISLSTFSRL